MFLFNWKPFFFQKISCVITAYQLNTEPRIFPVEAAIKSNIELYVSIASREEK